MLNTTNQSNTASDALAVAKQFNIEELEPRHENASAAWSLSHDSVDVEHAEPTKK